MQDEVDQDALAAATQAMDSLSTVEAARLVHSGFPEPGLDWHLNILNNMGISNSQHWFQCGTTWTPRFFITEVFSHSESAQVPKDLRMFHCRDIDENQNDNTLKGDAVAIATSDAIYTRSGRVVRVFNHDGNKEDILVCDHQRCARCFNKSNGHNALETDNNGLKGYPFLHITYLSPFSLKSIDNQVFCGLNRALFEGLPTSFDSTLREVLFPDNKTRLVKVCNGADCERCHTEFRTQEAIEDREAVTKAMNEYFEDDGDDAEEDEEGENLDE